MEIAIYIGIGLLVLLAIFLVVVATRPAEFRIERSGQVAAPAGVVFGIINNQKQFGRWSPWEHLDPNMQKGFEGPGEGPGAIYTWSGNSKAGEGRMTILDSKAAEFVAMKLEFIRPFACTNQVRFAIAPTPGGCKVDWIMDGKNNFMAKGFDLIMNMDKMVGADFERGLANLDRVAQEEAKKTG